MTNHWPKSEENSVYRGAISPVLVQAKELYPARFYAQTDNAAQPAPVTGWWDVWRLSDISNVPPCLYHDTHDAGTMGLPSAN